MGVTMVVLELGPDQSQLLGKQIDLPGPLLMRALHAPVFAMGTTLQGALGFFQEIGDVPDEIRDLAPGLYRSVMIALPLISGRSRELVSSTSRPGVLVARG